MDKKTIKEVTTFAVEQLKAANIRNGHVHESSLSGCYLNVRRSFSIEGAISVDYKPHFENDGKKEKQSWRAIVRVNFPACNKSVAEAAAFLHIVQELTLLAASLQAQLNEFEIPFELP